MVVGIRRFRGWILPGTYQLMTYTCTVQLSDKARNPAGWHFDLSSTALDLYLADATPIQISNLRNQTEDRSLRRAWRKRLEMKNGQGRSNDE